MTYRVSPQLGWNFDGLVVDNFAGGGGASTGIEMALGRPVDIAINHDPLAISMHTVNHPGTRHYLDNVWQVDPREVTRGRPVSLAWFSPDCTHHSKARGGKPVSPRVRGLAWVVLKWAGLVRPRVIMLENVEEFEDWGPLTRSRRPCPRRKGMIFEKFVGQLQDLGYQVEWQQLRACDYGAPTIRKRLFLVARCDGQPIVWPEPTHGPGRKKPYRTAAEIIDWSIPCPSIFDRKRPLAEKTLARIAKGIQRYVIEPADPFIAPAGAIVGCGGRAGQSRPRGLDEPLQTITTKADACLVTALLTEHANGSSQRVFSADEPLRTQVAGIKGGHFALVSAFMAKHYGGVVGQKLEKPLGTITTKDHHSLVQAFLLKYYGTNIGHDAREPLQTITSRHRFGLVTVHGQDYQILDIGMRMLKPHELFAAQGFPPDYVIDRDAQDNRITGTAQVAKCGNSVPPPVVAALVRANVNEAISVARAS